MTRRPHANPKSRKMDGEQEAHLITLCCSTPPQGRRRWTLKLLAAQLVKLEIFESISPATVSRMLKKRVETMAKKGMVYSARSECGVCL